MNHFAAKRTTEGVNITFSPIFKHFFIQSLEMLLSLYAVPLHNSEKLKSVLLGKVSYKTDLPEIEEDWHAERETLTSERVEAIIQWLAVLQKDEQLSLSVVDTHLLIVCINDLRLHIGTLFDIQADDLAMHPKAMSKDKEQSVAYLHLLGSMQCDIIEQLE